MSDHTIKALVFDVFGTVVDWRSALLAEFRSLARDKGWTVAGQEFLERWESVRRGAMNRVNDGSTPWINLSEIYRRRLDAVLDELGLDGMDAHERDHFNRVWCRAHGWPDSLPALRRLKQKFVLATLTNNDFAWAVELARHAGLPWDCVFTAELFKRYKPDPQTYRGALELLAVAPHEAMMVACHNYDLAAAAACGMRTAFIPRKEFSAEQSKDQVAEGEWTIVARDLNEVAARLGA
jgi:2-haloacid dehalogenase